MLEKKHSTTLTQMQTQYKNSNASTHVVRAQYCNNAKAIQNTHTYNVIWSCKSETLIIRRHHCWEGFFRVRDCRLMLMPPRR